MITIENDSVIAKPTGSYVNILSVLKLTNEQFNGYKSDIRVLVEAFINIDIPWEKQNKRISYLADKIDELSMKVSSLEEELYKLKRES